MAREKTYPTINDAKAILTSLLWEAPIELMRNRPGFGHTRERYAQAIENLSTRTSDLYFSFEFEWAWAIGCRLSISTEKDWSATKSGKLLGSIKCELSWSSTGRTLAQAAAAIDLYGQTLRFAQYVQSIMDEVGQFETEA